LDSHLHKGHLEKVGKSALLTSICFLLDRPNAAKGITLEGFKEKLEELKNTTRKVRFQ
jgi:hypothetical protein